MNRPASLIVPWGLLFLLPIEGAAQEGADVLDPDTRPRRILYEHLLDRCGTLFNERDRAVASLKAPEDLRKRQRELKAKFLEAIGPLPDRTPLNTRVVGKVEGEGYRIEKLIYETRPAHFVSALLYLPDGEPPFPGVLVPCGHTANGKVGYQKICILLAKHGFAVLCYDPIGQGERYQILDGSGRPAIRSTGEHTMVTIGALLVGWSGANYRIWDGFRSMDVLAGRPEVDARRLGCTGNSGGGLMTSYLMALDDRIAAAAPGCYITSLEEKFVKLGPADGEQNVPGQVAFGLNHPDYISMRAPKPTLILCATQDFVPIDGTWTTYREAKKLYGLMGHAERVDLFEFNDKHSYSRPRREAALRWFLRWLAGKDGAVREGEFPVFPASEIRCTETGQVLTSLGGKSVINLAAARARGLAPRRERLRTGPREELLNEVRRKLSLDLPVVSVAPRNAGALEREGMRFEKAVFETEPGLPVPALIAGPRKPARDKEQFLLIHGAGKAGSLARIEAWAKDGHRVVAADLRGWGETSPSGGRRDRIPLFGYDSSSSLLSLRMGRSLLGQRVRDLLAVVGWMADTARAPIHVVGVGPACPAVLTAAVLDQRIAAVSIEGGLTDWVSVVRTPMSRNQMGNVVQGILEVADLPDLASLLAPRPLTIWSPVDAEGILVSARLLEQVYGVVRGAYRRAMVSDRLEIEAGPTR